MSDLIDASGLTEALRRFAGDRDWDQFHTPKNLAMALAVEAGELLEIFQWMTPEQSAAVVHDSGSLSRAREEVADVLIYLVRLADILRLDLDTAVRSKLDLNAQRYPAEQVRGSATKAPGADRR